MKKTVVLFQTHFFDRWAQRAYQRLRRGAPSHFDVVALIHLPPGAPVPDRVRNVPHHVVRTPELRSLPYPVKSGGEDWHLWGGGHTDLISMRYCLAHPEYEHYWSIEYDVAFSGSWRRCWR